MKLNMPSNLEEAIIAIAELQTAANWTEGQLNLLQSFILSNGENLKSFAQYTAGVVNTNEPNTEQMRNVAKTLLDSGLSKHLPKQGPNPPTGGKSRPELKIVK